MGSVSFVQDSNNRLTDEIIDKPANVVIIYIILLSYCMTIQQLPLNTPLSEQVCQMIETQIVNGEYLVGDKLPTEKQLSEMFQVSRTVIREAIKGLKEKGLVETHVAKGTFVVNNVTKSVQSSFDATVRMQPEERFSNLIQVRLILEPEIAALAAKSASDEDIERMRQAVNQMESALENQNNVEEFIRGDFSFHMAMAESTGNNLIRLIIAPVVNLMRDSQRYHLSNVEGGDRKSQRNHKKIMQAIENHDAEAARKHMHAHIAQVRDDIQKQVGSEETQIPPMAKS
jgi:GntR family transcriptional repressor for pyruvate dehydrogenase complex